MVGTHDKILMILIHNTVDWSRSTKEGRAITPGRPASVLGNLIRLITVRFVLEKFSNDFDGLSAEKAPLLVEAILCLETRWSIASRYKDTVTYHGEDLIIDLYLILYIRVYKVNYFLNYLDHIGIDHERIRGTS